MADVETASGSDGVLKVIITKAGETLEVDTNAIPPDAYRIIVMEGLKAVLNKGMSKIKTKDLEGEDLEKAKAAALAKAKENLEQVMADKLRKAGAKGEKVSGKVKTEAMRLARNLVKDGLKAQKLKISHYSASDITEAAKLVLEENPELMEQAKDNLAEREATPVKINLGALKPDPKKVEAAEKAKAKKAAEKPLSAKQAGMTAKRKGQPQATAH